MTGTHYALGVNVQGNRITAYVDGSWVMDFKTSTLCPSGSLGLITAYAKGSFANITVLNRTYDSYDPFFS